MATTSAAALVARGSRSRVLMLTAAQMIEDRVDGLGLGADDYLPKPFAFAELVARVRALPAATKPSARRPRSRRSSPRHRRSGSQAAPAADSSSAEGARGARASAHRRRRPRHQTRELLARGWDEYVDPDGTSSRSRSAGCDASSVTRHLIETVPHTGYRIGQ